MDLLDIKERVREHLKKSGHEAKTDEAPADELHPGEMLHRAMAAKDWEAIAEAVKACHSK